MPPLNEWIALKFFPFPVHGTYPLNFVFTKSALTRIGTNLFYYVSGLVRGPFPHRVRDARQQKGGRPGPVGHVSSSYPSRGPSCSHGSDVAPVD